ncbi:MAG: Do family serine endopeptidase [Gammaproteobacteria bacterium]|nr:Do family serine endopeptidase [Gammaproteobacteria bacterium]
MQLKKLLSFLVKAAIAGLAAAFIVLYLWPDLLHKPGEPQTQVAAPLPAATGPASYAGAVERAAPAVVNINTSKLVIQRNPFFDDPFMQRFFRDNPLMAPRRQLESSLGSGVIVSNDGYVLTNHHVIAEADEIQVTLSDGRSARASVVGSDPESDIAVLKIDLDKVPVITFGNSEQLRVGDVVLAIGDPFGVGQTVTLGIVSATGRNHLGINTFENFIQTDAAINPGNSGGALINAHGQLVGINSAIYSRSGGSLGIGFAIPVSIANGVMRQIIEHGRAIRGWLGVEAQAITPELAESFKLSAARGIIVAGIVPDGPADKAGLQPGDVVNAVNGRAVDEPRAFMTLVAGFTPGARVELQGQRNGAAFTLSAKVGERPAPN